MIIGTLITAAAFNPLRVLLPLPLHCHLSKFSVIFFFPLVVSTPTPHQLKEGLSMHGSLSCIPVSAAKRLLQHAHCLKPPAALLQHAAWG